MGHRRRRDDLAAPGAADHDPVPPAGRRPGDGRRPARVLLVQRGPGRVPAADADGPPGVPAARLGRRHARRSSAARPLRRSGLSHRGRPDASSWTSRRWCAARSAAVSLEPGAGIREARTAPILRAAHRRPPPRTRARRRRGPSGAPCSCCSSGRASRSASPRRWCARRRPAGQGGSSARRARALGDAAASRRRHAAPRAGRAPLLGGFAPRIVPGVPPVFAAGLLSNALAGSSCGDLATDDERQVVLRGLPHNPTTEMDLALWALAQRGRAPTRRRATLRETPPERLARGLPRRRSCRRRFRRASPTSCAATVIAAWPRSTSACRAGRRTRRTSSACWPTTSASTTRSWRPTSSSAGRRGEAEEMVAELTRRARARAACAARWSAFLLEPGARPGRPAGGAQVLARPGAGAGRALLRPVGEELARPGVWRAPRTSSSSPLPEAWAALAGADLRPVVRERRADYERELRRRHVPRILLSDGTEPEAAGSRRERRRRARGTPASAGRGDRAGARDPRPDRRAPGAGRDPGRALDRPRLDAALPHGRRPGDGDGRRRCPTARSSPASTASRPSSACPTPPRRIATGQRVTVDGSAGTIDLWDARSSLLRAT